MIKKCTYLEYFVGYFLLILLLITMPSNQEEITIGGIGVTEQTTLQYDIEVTDMPQKDVMDALMLDEGQYTTISYHYAVNQWIHHSERHQWVGAATDARHDMCYHHYLKCATSMEAPLPVCMFHTQNFASGVKTGDTYCDAYFENCRIGYQYWRLLGYGRCDLGWMSDELIEI